MSETDLSSEFVTIYFDFPLGRAVDIRTLGATLVEFEQFSRSIAARADPFLNFEIFFSQSDTGSLKIITKLREQIPKKHLRFLARAIIVTLIWNTGAAIISEDTVRQLLEKMGYPEETLSDTQVKQVHETVRDALKSEEVKKSKGAIFSALDASDEITAFGAQVENSPGKPSIVIPKDEFASLAISTNEEETEEPATREVPGKAQLIILIPVLSQGSKAKWQFRYGGHKINARVTDQKFLKKALSGEENIPLVEGVALHVALIDHQSFKDGVWQHQGYEVRHVESWVAPRAQKGLFPDSGKN